MMMTRAMLLRKLWLILIIAGFKRVDPTASAKQKKKVKNLDSKNVPEQAQKEPRASQKVSKPDKVLNKRYCQFWNNSGNCSYKNCKFLHEKALTCKYDGSCNRTKCMFFHVTQNGSSSPPPFLEHPAPAWGPWGAPWSQPQASWGQPPATWGSPWGYNMGMMGQPGPWVQQGNGQMRQ